MYIRVCVVNSLEYRNINIILHGWGVRLVCRARGPVRRQRNLKWLLKITWYIFSSQIMNDSQTITKWYSSSSEPFICVQSLISWDIPSICLPYSISRLCGDNRCCVVYCLSLTFETVRRYCDISKVGLKCLNIRRVGLVSIPRLQLII